MNIKDITIKNARIEDSSTIENILLDAVNWLNEMQQPLWRPEDITWNALEKAYRIDDFYIAYINGTPAGCMVLMDSDPFFWPDVPEGEALMIHKLAVNKTARKSGVGDALINYAKDEGKRRGASSIRLDCHQYRSKLRAFYERHGYICVGEKTFNGKWYTAFYVYNIPKDKESI